MTGLENLLPNPDLTHEIGIILGRRMRANIVAKRNSTLSKAKGHLNFSLMKLFELRKKKLFISKGPLPVA